MVAIGRLMMGLLLLLLRQAPLHRGTARPLAPLISPSTTRCCCRPARLPAPSVGLYNNNCLSAQYQPDTVRGGRSTYELHRNKTLANTRPIPRQFAITIYVVMAATVIYCNIYIYYTVCLKKHRRLSSAVASSNTVRF